MHAPSVLATLASAASVSGFNLGKSWYGVGSGSGSGAPSAYGGSRPSACLNETGVNALITGYTYLLEAPGGPDFNATANAILSDNFVVYSDSILTLRGSPLGQIAYPSREVYIQTQFQTPPLPTVTTTGSFATCDKIAWRWTVTGLGNQALPVNGLITMDVDVASLRINTLHSEFNTAAFKVDIGQ